MIDTSLSLYQSNNYPSVFSEVACTILIKVGAPISNISFYSQLLEEPNEENYTIGVYLEQ